ncbi:MAG: hypothetical protein WCY65_03655 [Candidatus Methanomethylophilaceae archaeon]
MSEDKQGNDDRHREQEMKDMAKQMLAAFTNRETQRHFIRAGMEMMMGFDALLRSMPMTDDMKAVMDKATEYATFVSKEICSVNPNCSCRNHKSDDLEKIDLD